MQVVPDWVILIVWPPTVSVVARGVTELALDAMVTPTVPLPLPEVGDTVAQPALLEADQVQLAPLAVMPMVPAPPPAANGLPRAEVSTVTLQDSACSTTVNSVPPMEIDPVRLVVVELGSAVYPNVPDVLPEPPEVTVIQLGPKVVL